MYNIPARSIVDINVDTMKRLYELKNVAGVKDAHRQHGARLAAARSDRRGLQPALRRGHHGAGLQSPMAATASISVTSNVAPRLCSEFQAACQKGDYATALKLQDKLAPLHLNLFVETSPAPIKYAMSLLGKCERLGAAADGAGSPRRRRPRCARRWCIRG